MQVTRTLGGVTVVAEGDKFTDVFDQLAASEEVFQNSATCNCGHCSGTNLKWQVRDHDGDPYYEIVCQDCWAKFTFGVKKDKNAVANLFPHRKWGPTHPKAGEYIPKNGWKKYNKETQVEE
mgnify:CR=1 FL=1|jgi:hypothetical protein